MAQRRPVFNIVDMEEEEESSAEEEDHEYLSNLDHRSLTAQTRMQVRPPCGRLGTRHT